MIPIGDENPTNRRTPFVVFALLAVNIGAFIYEISLGDAALQQFVLSWGVTPYEITNRVDVPPLIGPPVWVTAFTSMFLHGGWLHIGGNMLYLWIFGDNVEDAMGHIPFLLFYLLCGVGAVALHVLVAPENTIPMIGASGALSGVMGAYLIMFPRRSVRVLIFLGIFVTVIALPAIIVIGFWIALQFMIGLATLGPETSQTSGVAYFAHIGGFLTGVVLLLLWRRPITVARRRAARSWE